MQGPDRTGRHPGRGGHGADGAGASSAGALSTRRSLRTRPGCGTPESRRDGSGAGDGYRVANGLDTLGRLRADRHSGRPRRLGPHRGQRWGPNQWSAVSGQRARVSERASVRVGAWVDWWVGALATVNCGAPSTVNARVSVGRSLLCERIRCLWGAVYRLLCERKDCPRGALYCALCVQENCLWGAGAPSTVRCARAMISVGRRLLYDRKYCM